MKKSCELCKCTATIFCESDQASLCWTCDAKVHSANFLVARHSRSLLCHVCKSPTPWSAAGEKLGRTVSFCERCVQGSDSRKQEEEKEESEGGKDEDFDEDGDYDSDDDDDDDDDVDDDEDGDNQVVPLTSSTTSLAPPAASCSSNEDIFRVADDGRDVSSKNIADLSEDEFECSSFGRNIRPLKIRKIEAADSVEQSFNGFTSAVMMERSINKT